MWYLQSGIFGPVCLFIIGFLYFPWFVISLALTFVVSLAQCPDVYISVFVQFISVVFMCI